MGIFFSDKKPRVSKEELKKIRQSLFNRDLKDREIDFVMGMFSSDMDESGDQDKGIQKEEIEAHVAWLKANTHLHTLTPEEVKAVEEEFEKRL